MSSAILETFATTAVPTCTLGSLPANSGRQTDLVDNTSTLAPKAKVYFQLTLGANPGAGQVEFYCIHCDAGSPAAYDYGAGATDAAWTPPPYATPDHVVALASPGASQVVQGSFDLFDLGPKYAIGVFLRSLSGLAASTHFIRVKPVYPTAQ